MYLEPPMISCGLALNSIWSLILRVAKSPMVIPPLDAGFTYMIESDAKKLADLVWCK
jgi:hypothetical protein